jgi:superoxide dismutase, Fe-Mn family
MALYQLPDLPYDFSALEPHLSGKIMELHHGKHHAAYVKNANRAVEQLDEACRGDTCAGLVSLEKELAFHLSGHILHSLFWQNLQPKGAPEPTGDLATAVKRHFGGFDHFKRHMSQVAATIMGSGWAALVWEPLGQRLVITQIYDHQSNLSQSGVPIMVLDAWEHAYYLQYQSRKDEYFAAIWNVWNWQDISRRFQSAMELELQLPGATKRA